MSIVGILEIDIHIISFCDLETITNLLFMGKLINEAIPNIIISNNIDNLAHFFINLISMDEIELVKKFIMEIENTITDLDEYYQIIFEDWGEEILEIYLNVNINYDKMITYFGNYLDECNNGIVTDDSWFFMIDIINIYRIAFDYNNTQILKFLLKIARYFQWNIQSAFSADCIFY